MKKQQPRWKLTFLSEEGGAYITVGQSNALTGTRTVGSPLQFYSHARDESSKRKTEGQC